MCVFLVEGALHITRGTQNSKSLMLSTLFIFLVEGALYYERVCFFKHIKMHNKTILFRVKKIEYMRG